MSTVKVTNLQNAGSASVNMTLDTAGNATVANTLAMGSSFLRNRIINGDMKIAQRGNAVNVSASGGNTYISCDRFTLTNYWGSGQVNTAKSTVAPTGFTNSLSLTVATAAPMNGSTGYSAVLWQPIEGFNISDAYTGLITLSFWVRSSVTGTYSVAFSNVNSTSLATGSRLYVVNYTINAANTWEQKTVTLDLASGVSSGTWNTTNGTGLCIGWNLGSESNRKGNTFLNTWGTISSAIETQSGSQTNWISNSGATFYITGVQLEVGGAATPFERRQYGQELALCQRYYVGGDFYLFTVGYDASYPTRNTGGLTWTYQFRATPTIAIAAGAMYGHHNTAPSVFDGPYSYGVVLQFAGSAYRANTSTAANAIIVLSAEL